MFATFSLKGVDVEFKPRRITNSRMCSFDEACEMVDLVVSMHKHRQVVKKHKVVFYLKA